MPTVLNAANEVLVSAFLKEKIKFTQIAELLELMLNQTENEIKPSLENIIEVDHLTRKQVLKLIEK